MDSNVTVFWVLRDTSGAQHVPSPVIKFPTKRKKKRRTSRVSRDSCLGPERLIRCSS